MAAAAALNMDSMVDIKFTLQHNRSNEFTWVVKFSTSTQNICILYVDVRYLSFLQD